ncbi:MAG: hypothetical protein ACYC9P_03010 [Rudaea sp.]
MNSIAHVLALAYHDGPIEGFAQSDDGTSYFFKAIAWDRDRDRRLFAFARANSELVEQLMLRLNGQEKQKTPIWVPSWNFDSQRDRDNADQLVLNASSDLSGPWIIGVGDSPLSLDSILEVPSEHEHRVVRAVTSAEIGALDAWEDLLPRSPRSKE